MRRARLDRADLSADIAQPVHGAHAGRLAISQAGWRELRECKSVARRSRICLAARCDPQGANLNGSELGGADFLRADVTNTDFENGDVTSTRLIGLRGRDKARNLDRVRNLDRALND
ncbi:MAG: pentapeptide repeat-containing protein [Pseudolabrys sp.]